MMTPATPNQHGTTTERVLWSCTSNLRLIRQPDRPSKIRQDLGRAWQELRRTATQQGTAATGRAQAQIAAALAKDTAGQLAYDLGRQVWMTYDHGLWKHLETERVTQRIMACMDTVLQGDDTWHA